MLDLGRCLTGRIVNSSKGAVVREVLSQDASGLTTLIYYHLQERRTRSL